LLDDWSFAVDDQSQQFNARGRIYRWYEVAGMVKKALVVSPSDEVVFERMSFAGTYSCATEPPPTMLLVISSLRTPLGSMVNLDPGIHVTMIDYPCR
jgi:hypothetical protein